MYVGYEQVFIGLLRSVLYVRVKCPCLVMWTALSLFLKSCSEFGGFPYGRDVGFTYTHTM